MSFNQLKVEEIEKIFLKIYENACELIEEAENFIQSSKICKSLFVCPYSI
ncbi:hypothetical protein QF028_004954 [Neobacillus sp. B4I6]